jgi:hypothetical protein
MLKNKMLSAMGGPEPSDPDFEYVTMLLHGDGTNGGQNNTFLDSSTNNFTITRNGNTTQGSFSPYGPNWSNYFDGNGDYLGFPNNAVFDFSTGNFTVEAWVYRVGTGTGTQIYESIIGGNAGASPFWNLYVNSSNNTIVWFGNDNTLRPTSSTITNNTWNHVAVSRSSGTLKIFINGVEGYSASVSTAYSLGSGGGSVGFDSVTTSNKYFFGYISNVRVVKGTAVYTANFTPSTTPLTAVSGTSLLTCQSNRFIDNSSNNFAVTVNGNPSVQRFSPFAPPAAYSTATIGGSGYFDGASTTYLVAGTGTATAFDFGTGDFTIECWAYVTAQAGSFTLMGSTTSSTTQYWGFGSIGIGGMSMYAGTSGTDIYSGSASTPALNQWNHLVWQRSSGTASMYLNGTRVYNATYTANFGATADGFRVGNSDAYANYYTNGYISNFRVVKGSAVYSGATITVPTTPLTAVTNTQLLLGFTNAAIFDNAMMNDLETVGNAQISTSVVKYGTGSLNFAANDGGAYLLLPSSENTALGGDFTIEFWLNPDTVSTSYADGSLATIFDADAGAGANSTAWWAIHQQNSTLVFSANNANRLTSDAELSASTWQHCALVRSGTTVTWYIDGVAEGSTTYSTAVTGPRRLFIAKQSGAARFYKGYIDDLRITKGVARYTANFTPPTVALPNK